MPDLFDEMNITGRSWFRGALPDEDVKDILSRIADPDRPGHRHLSLSNSVTKKVLMLARQIHSNTNIIGTTLFVKSPEHGWSLPWHQDRTIPMRSHIDHPEFSRWSRKSGVWYCEPPLSYLQTLMFAHILLDDVELTSGPMEIALGSHRHGRIVKSDIADVLQSSVVEACTGKTGDLVLVSGLTLHRSQKFQSSRFRRTLRIDFLPPLTDEWEPLGL